MVTSSSQNEKTMKNTTIFNTVKEVDLKRPLPSPQPQRFVALHRLLLNLEIPQLSLTGGVPWSVNVASPPKPLGQLQGGTQLKIGSANSPRDIKLRSS